MVINKLVNLFLLLLPKNNMLYYIIMLAPYTRFLKFHTAMLKKIINNYSACRPLCLWPVTQDINPQRLQPNKLWQIDVTHCPKFSPSSFLYVCIYPTGAQVYIVKYEKVHMMIDTKFRRAVHLGVEVRLEWWTGGRGRGLQLY